MDWLALPLLGALVLALFVMAWRGIDGREFGD